MNGKRAEMLRMIAAQREPKTITSVVDDISDALRCPKSTVWANIGLLKELGLVKNGRGKPVRITGLGRAVLGKVLKAGMEEDGFVPQAGMVIYRETEEDQRESGEEVDV
jgi:predicted transcriptional regulator